MAGHRFSANIAKLPELLSKPKRNVRSREKRTSSGHRADIVNRSLVTPNRHGSVGFAVLHNGLHRSLTAGTPLNGSYRLGALWLVLARPVAPPGQ